MRKMLVLAAAAIVAAAPSFAHAHGRILTGHKQYDQYGFVKRHGPRAAPWFLYWPYETYFNTAAPTGAPFGPSHMTPGGFQYPQQQPAGGFVPYSTNGFGQKSH
jgi:hypothetical protein